jgi:hypothetical protein
VIQEVRVLLEEYQAWLKDKSSLRQVGDWVEITTPYLDRHNDYLQMYVRKEGPAFHLTDDGATLADLEMSGCNLDSHKRQALLREVLNGFGVRLVNSALEVTAQRDTFSHKKHSLIQAMLSVGDMFSLARPLVSNLFFEDVVAWLDLLEVRYTSRVKLTGKSGYDHQVDLVIPKSRRCPERLIQVVNRPNRESAQAVTFFWIDTKEVRAPDARAIAMLNDADHPAPDGVVAALQNYHVAPVLWSQRDGVQQELVQ